ncbi:MAG TPA: hypothetical protein VKU19_12375 [Bryobacteraceae bacterium]|nr:hypothetical protein [Bryobacteraceae bacterium]
MPDRLDLELELAEELCPVAAPHELWERIRNAAGDSDCPVPVRPIAIRRPEPSWSVLPIAAIVTIMVAAASLWMVTRGQGRGIDLQQLAMQELRTPAPSEFDSNDPAQVNDWMRRQAGIELNIPEHTSACITGARVIRRAGERIAAVTYRVGEQNATLLVARGGQSAHTGHGRAQWQAHGQSYAVATSNLERSDAACLLCHTAL